MDQFEVRRYVIIGLMILIAIIFTIRLFSLQVLDQTYKLSAESNTRRMEIIYPARGLIYDRNNVLLVHNQPTYDLKIAPFELEAFDSTELCDILGIDIQTLRDGIKKVRTNAAARRNPFIKQVSPEVFGKLKEKQYKFPGFYFSLRTLRKYEYKSAAHLLGYVGEVDSAQIKLNSYYEMGDYYGKSGVEMTYEEELRGDKGRIYRLINVHGKEVGAYKEGKFDSDATMGKNITLTIDTKLQQYGEELMDGYKGSIVAIEPKSGEVLAYISAPGYDPNLLVGRKFKENYSTLYRDTLKPLFNNAIMAAYPPGSTFKAVTGLISLHENLLFDNTKYYCDLGYYARGVSAKCHYHPSPLKLEGAVMHSCNAYFYHVFKNFVDNKRFERADSAYQIWRNHAASFGLGRKLGIDLPYERNGFIPQPEYYDRWYGKRYWKAHTIISNAIGQGEILTTPLQLANLAASLANKGYYYVPHVVKAIEDKETIDEKYLTRQWTTVDTSYYDVIRNGMDKAVNEQGGTGYYMARVRGLDICGKTGTAQNPHGEDHSVFMAFAPKDNPKIAISVYVEHGEWGASYAAPIASLMIEKYLTDSISPARKWIEKKMMDDSLLHIQ